MSSGEFIGEDVRITPSPFGKGFQEVMSAGAGTRAIEDQVKGPEILQYQLEFNPVNWRWLKYLMSVVDADDSGTKTHTFSITDDPTSWKMEWAKHHTTDHVLTLTGNTMRSATISFEKANAAGTEGKIRVVADCIAKTQSQGSSVTSISALTKKAFQYRHSKLTLNGNEITEVNNGEITIDNGIRPEDSRYCNSTLDVALGEPIPTYFRVSGRFNVNVKDKTYYDLWDTADAISSTNKLEFIRDGDTNDQAVFTFSGFHIHEAVAPTNIDGVTNVDIVWVANSVSPVVRDDITTY
jgi:hypothetical protein